MSTKNQLKNPISNEDLSAQNLRAKTRKQKSQGKLISKQSKLHKVQTASYLEESQNGEDLN